MIVALAELHLVEVWLVVGAKSSGVLYGENIRIVDPTDHVDHGPLMGEIILQLFREMADCVTGGPERYVHLGKYNCYFARLPLTIPVFIHPLVNIRNVAFASLGDVNKTLIGCVKRNSFPVVRKLNRHGDLIRCLYGERNPWHPPRPSH